MELKAGQAVMQVSPRCVLRQRVRCGLHHMYQYRMIPPGETAVVAADQSGVPTKMVRVEPGRPKAPTWTALRDMLVVLPNAEPETIAWFRMIYAL